MPEKKFIYLDTNVYCRPFDYQKQFRIKRESNAFLDILSAVIENEVILSVSQILKAEVSQITDPWKRVHIQSFFSHSTVVIFENEYIKNLARELNQNIGIKARDSLHLASAAVAKVEYFITADDYLLKKEQDINKILLQEGGFSLKLRLPDKFVEECL